MANSWTCLVLSGGTARRLGQDKAAMTIDERSALDFLLHGIDVGVPVVVVGPRLSVSRTDVNFIVEDPPLGGPVAGIDAGLSRIATDLVAVVAVDMPLVGAVLPELVRSLPTEADALVPVTRDGRQQFLGGIYRTDALRRVIATIEEVHGTPMWRVIQELQVRFLEVDAEFADCFIDVDTPEDLERVRLLVGKRGDERE